MKKKVNITLDSDLLDKLRDQAQTENRTLSGLINHLLRNLLKKP